MIIFDPVYGKPSGPSCSKLRTLVDEALIFSDVLYVKVLPFFAKKLYGAFAMQKLLTIFQQKILQQLILRVHVLLDLMNPQLMTSLSQ